MKRENKKCVCLRTREIRDTDHDPKEAQLFVHHYYANRGEEYFLSSRSLRWPSIAFSTIATNVGGYQFIGMMGSAYLYGLAQASLEINAVQGILLASFIFIPYYLKDKIITITQFIKKRLGENVALIYSLANISLFSTLTMPTILWFKP